MPACCSIASLSRPGVVTRQGCHTLDDFARFGYLAGWRRGEIAGLTWQMVDRAAKKVRLPTSKNGSGRVLPLEGELWGLIERRWGAREVPVSEGVSKIAGYVFHRKGSKIMEFRKSWAAACTAATTSRAKRTRG